MTQEEIAVLEMWLIGCLLVAALCATTFPLLWGAFSKWNDTLAGKLLMFMALTYAAAVDLTAYFVFFPTTNVLVQFWTQAIVFGLIAISSAAMTVTMVRMNYRQHKKKVNHV